MFILMTFRLVRLPDVSAHKNLLESQFSSSVLASLSWIRRFNKHLIYAFIQNIDKNS